VGDGEALPVAEREVMRSVEDTDAEGVELGVLWPPKMEDEGLADAEAPTLIVAAAELLTVELGLGGGEAVLDGVAAGEGVSVSDADAVVIPDLTRADFIAALRSLKAPNG
jgi:hypothetical protein